MEEDVVTGVLSVAVVGGELPNVVRSSEALLTEPGGLAGAEVSSDLRGEEVDINEADSLLSEVGFEGGGMHIFARSAAAFDVWV